jgi:tripartite-type tricarboxylate transporter receptor subunit TctC
MGNGKPSTNSIPWRHVIMMIKIILSSVFTAVALGLSVNAQAQVDKPVKILVGFAPGGSADSAARLLSERLSLSLKQPVIVENKPGAGGRIAAEALKNAAADGSIIMVAPVVVPVLAPLVFDKLPYNPSTDFAPIAHIANFQFSLSVNAAHPAKTPQELAAWFKANPANANFGSPAPGSLPHFFGVMLARGIGVDLVHVPFNGGGPMMTALAGNQVSSGFDAMVDQIELHRAGKTRIIATAGSARSPLLPDVPTFTEAGIKGVEGSGWFAAFAPAKTSEATIKQLNEAINAALKTPEVRERFAKLGLEMGGGSPADLTALVKRDTERWAPVVKASGFKGN